MWEIFESLNMTFHHVYLHATCALFVLHIITFHGRLQQITMTKGLHLIPIDFSTPHHKTVSKNFSIYFVTRNHGGTL